MILNKVAVITGGARGIGRAHAEVLLDRKAKVLYEIRTIKSAIE